MTTGQIVMFFQAVTYRNCKFETTVIGESVKVKLFRGGPEGAIMTLRQTGTIEADRKERWKEIDLVLWLVDWIMNMEQEDMLTDLRVRGVSVRDLVGSDQ